MPKTFQDAITVARGIGIRYLWIDALCIIQDSTEDWIEEAGRMNDIYSDATLTIFATGSSSAVEGFLKERVPVSELSLPWRISTQMTGKVFVRMGHEYNHDWDDNFLNDPPWRARGWTLQERLSAGRGLSYTQFQMSWHCLTCIYRENGEHEDQASEQRKAIAEQIRGVRDAGRLTTLSYRWAALIRTQDPRQHGLDIQTHHALLVDQFYRITNEYESRSFNFPSDKLPATTGLAKMLEAKLEGRDRYWAGLWESYLAEGLIWKVL